MSQCRSRTSLNPGHPPGDAGTFHGKLESLEQVRTQMASQPAEPQKRTEKGSRAMLSSVAWNLSYRFRQLQNRLRFGLPSWRPKGSHSSYLAYYPDSFSQLPDFRSLYNRWIRGNKVNNNGDASRFIALLLNLRLLEADNVPGEFAELGVWKGNSAALLADFSTRMGRRLFLFDTFSGFDERDLVGVDSASQKLFADTSIAYVKETVQQVHDVTYLPGFFPETLTAEVEQSTFALVHIDCDLYSPMKAALEFFYPRLSKGGMLILHDYSSGVWEGGTQAIDEFRAATGEFLCLWPDKSGTAMIRKSK